MNRWTYVVVSFVAVAAAGACADDSSTDSAPASASAPSTVVETVSAPTAPPPPTRPPVSETTTLPQVSGVTTTLSAPSEPARLVVIGDSIPYNSPDDCPGCTGLVDRYAAALEAATGRTVEAENLTQHNGLTLPMLMDELDQFETSLRRADAIVVAAAHNSILLNADAACGTTWDDQLNSWTDWSLIDSECTATWTAEYQPMYDELFNQIAEWRNAQPTILLALNKYNDWIGWPEGHLTPEQNTATTMVHDAWNQMICESAAQNGFTCADVYHAFNGPDGTMPAGALLAADHAHPSDTGNELIANLLADHGFTALT
jgi:lysophospholipase L1-like esterase